MTENKPKKFFIFTRNKEHKKGAKQNGCSSCFENYPIACTTCNEGKVHCEAVKNKIRDGKGTVRWKCDNCEFQREVIVNWKQIELILKS